MKYTAMLLSLSLLVSAGAVAGRALAAEANKTSQTIFRAGSQSSFNGPAEFFTGNVRVDRLSCADDFNRDARKSDGVGFVAHHSGQANLLLGSSASGQFCHDRRRDAKHQDARQHYSSWESELNASRLSMGCESPMTPLLHAG